MKAMKFRVKDEEHSEAIQKKLFELGYKWSNYGKSIEYTYMPCLYAWEDGKILYSDDCNGTFDHFNSEYHKNREEYILSPQGEFVKAADYFKQPETPPVKPVEPIGLLPKAIHDKQRMYEILDAMRRYVDADKKIPMMWIAELDDLGGEYVEEEF